MRRFTALLLALGVAMAGCGGGSTDVGTSAGSSPAGRGSFPVTVDAANGKVRIDEMPRRIVSLSATATETLFAIDAGDQVVAVDEQSDHPAEAPTTDLSGLQPNIEAIAGYDPDLAVIAYEPGDLEKSLEKLEIPVLLMPAAESLDDALAQIEQLGSATGHESEASDLVTSMRTEIDDIVESAPEFERTPTYYHELDDNYFTATSQTFIGEMYGMFGLENIADEAKGAGSGYPQLSAEYIVKADPDIIFLADTECCGVSAAKVAKRPGWEQITAVKRGDVVELEDDTASRWGPRIVEFVRTIGRSLQELAQAA